MGRKIPTGIGWVAEQKQRASRARGFLAGSFHCNSELYSSNTFSAGGGTLKLKLGHC